MALPHDDQELLSRSLHFCHGELLENPKAHERLAQLGLTEAALLKSLSVGLSLGRLTQILPESEAVLAAAKALGFLDEKGRDRFTNHLILPLRSPKGHLAGYGTIDLASHIETLTLFEPFGCLHPSELRQTRRICLATSSLIALLLAQMGEKAALISTAHDIARHLSELSEFRFREAILALDGGELNENIARRLSIQGIEPFGFRLAAGEKIQEALRAVTEPGELLRQITPVAVKAERPAVESSEKGLDFTWPDRSYRVRLIEPHRFDHLKVSIKLTRDHRWHLDTIDLGLAKQRQAFLQMAKRVTQMEPALLYHDLLAITDEVERRQADRILHARKEETIGDELRREAEEFLKEPNFLERLVEDMKTLGWMSDPRYALIGYLALTSRKLDRPLATTWVEEESLDLAGLLLPLMPEEDLVYLSRPSPKALLYQDEEALAHRVVAAESHALSPETLSCLLKLSKGCDLRAQVVVREAQTGRLKTMAHHVRGPCAIFLTVNGRGRGRRPKPPGAPFIPLQAEKEVSPAEQLAWTALQEGPGRLEMQMMRERIVEKHRAVQKILKAYAVVNPQAEALLHREEDPLKYQRLTGLARAVALLRQQQKQVHAEGDRLYLEVDTEDLGAAANLCEVLTPPGEDWADLHPSAQRILKVVQQRMQVDPAASFTRAQAREWTGLGESAVREYVDQLEAGGYFQRLDGYEGRGKTFQYRIVEAAKLRKELRATSGSEVQEQQPHGKFEVGESAGGFAWFAGTNGHG